MENATKALLMAGAILIAIILIALGLKIVNSNKGVTEQVDKLSTSMEVSMFNSQFEPYTRQLQSASETKTLIDKIIANNWNKNKNEFITIYYYVKGNNNNNSPNYKLDYDNFSTNVGAMQNNQILKDILQAINNIANNSKFKISCQTSGNTGRITSISIKCEGITNAS